MAERSRREKQSKLEKLAEYRRAREGGKRVLKVIYFYKPLKSTVPLPFEHPQEENSDIYYEVSEDALSGIVKGRLQRDDFVVDDGAEGYVDNGMDDWESGYGEIEESDDEDDRRRCAPRHFGLYFY